MSRGTVMDRLFASAPLNATAATVVGAGGDHYEPDVKFGSFMHWDAPPPCKPMPVAASFVDMTGRSLGRLRVVGWLGKFNPKKKPLWLVRCACGDYEARHTAAVVAASSDDMCCKCRHWAKAKRRYEREGSRPLEDFIGERA